MNRTSLAAVIVLLAAAVSRAGRAADQPDPFAPSPDSKEPTSIDDDEATVLGAPNRPGPSVESQPAPPSAPPRPAPPPRRLASPRQASYQEGVAASEQAAADQSGFALELSTSGFASGSLAGGLFVGGRTATGLILGGIVDYDFTSLNMSGSSGSPDVTTSIQLFRIGAGVRQSFLQSADHLVDLYGAADVSFQSRSMEFIGGATTPTTKVSASGFSFAAGPGLRFWLHSQIAVGYLARFRLNYLSGPLAALTGATGDVTTQGSQTQIGFDGTFQVLGVF